MATFAAVEEFILEKMAETQLPGVSIALIDRGETVYSRGFGFRDIERGLPATPRTLYGIGSVTKSFTCIALLQLQEQGRLSVDDPIDKYLSFTVRPLGETVRIHHFMAHSSGIPALAYAEAVIRHSVGATDTYVPIGSYDDMLNFVNGGQAWTYARPGERWFYLNEGYVLLGAIIEQVSGMPYAAYVEQHILRPLGMERTAFTREEAQSDQDAAIPYVITKDKQQIPSRYLNGKLSSDGGLMSSVEEMAHYVAIFLADGAGPRGPIISAASLRAMMTPRVPLPLEVYPSARPTPSGSYGFGMSVYPDFYGRLLAGHGGSVLVSTAHMAVVPDRGIGVMVLANGSGYPMANIASFALAAMMDEDPWELPALRTERVLAGLVGAYETYRGTYQATVTRNGDFLIIAIRNKYLEQLVPLIPEDLDPGHPRFFTLSLGRRLPVEFIVADGEVEMIYERYRMHRTGRLTA